MAEQDKDKQPQQAKPEPVKVVDTAQYKEFKTLNGATRRDMK